MRNQVVSEKAITRSQKRGTRGIILGITALLALCVCYILICASVNPEQILPRTRIVYQDSANGIHTLDLSGLDREQALKVLGDEINYSDSTLMVRAIDTDYCIPVGNAVTTDLDAMTYSALAPSQVPFLFRGIGKLCSLVTWRDLKPQLTIGNEALLRADIESNGILNTDTTVYTTYELQDGALVLHKGIIGQHADEDALVVQLSKAVSSGDFSTPIDCAMIDGQLGPDWSAVERDICQKPRNAQLKLSDDHRAYEIEDSVAGYSFDSAQAQQMLDSAEEGSDVSIALMYTEPEVSAEQLKGCLFRDQLGTYTTIVSGTADRISNVRLAAEKCDGIILDKGDIFSYNGTLGERTAANGFKKAGAYLNGTTVQELGGGICQVSSTMYAAVLEANLRVVERHNHTFASSYIGLGMDATVSWGGPDFRFQNDRDYPIKIESRYRDGKATVTIWGTRTDQRTAEIESETMETIPYPTVTKKTSKLKKGKTRVSEKGSDGYKVQTYRLVYDDGQLVSREKEAFSVYKPHEQIVLQGGKGKKKSGKKKSGKSKKKASKKKKASEKGKKTR